MVDICMMVAKMSIQAHALGPQCTKIFGAAMFANACQKYTKAMFNTVRCGEIKGISNYIEVCPNAE